MALLSMTGYGRGECVSKGVKVEVELSSVNRKQLDVRVGLPSHLSALDSRIKKLIHNSLSRGSVSGVLRITRVACDAKALPGVDMDAAKNLLAQLRKAAKTLQVKDDIALSHIITMPNVVKSADSTLDNEVAWAIMQKAFKKALAGLVEMRKAEGKELQQDICERLVSLQKHLDVISSRVPVAEKNLKSRIIKNVREAGIKVASLDDRMQKEMIFYIDKANISEEIVRLKSHFKHIDQKIKSPEPVGRSLDFLCQEMFREINTIGSKSNDESISKRVVLFKTELESIREQVQNVE